MTINLGQPGHFGAVTPVDQTINQRFGQVNGNLQKDDRGDDSGNQHHLARQSPQLLGIGHGDHQDDDQRAQDRAAQQVVNQTLPHHTVGRQNTKIGHGVRQDNEHEIDDQIAQCGKQENNQGRQKRGRRNKNQERKNANARRRKGDA